MKSLVDFIKENMSQQTVNEAEDKATVSISFADLEGAEDVLKSLTDREGCSVEDNKLTITITKDNADKLDSVQDILQQYAETLRNSSKRSSDEQYAQKTKEFSDKVAEFNNKLEEIQDGEEE